MACTNKESRYTKRYPGQEKKDAFGGFHAFKDFFKRKIRLKILAVYFNGGGKFPRNKF